MEAPVEQQTPSMRAMMSLILKNPDDGVWRDEASCKKMGNEQFFQVLHNNSKEIARRVALVKHVCNSCTVVKECLDFAISNEIKDGIWGGMTPTERKQVSVMVQRNADR